MADAIELELGGHPALAQVSPSARAVLVLAHGAGAGMRHAWMADIAGALAARGVGVVRFDFPAMAAGKRRPDTPAVATAAVRAVVAAVHARWPALPLVAGGKSFGGRMTTTAQAQAPMPAVRGIVLLGCPLHPAGEPGVARAAHLRQVDVPMHFVSGDRDALATPALLDDILGQLGARASRHVVAGADHGFAVRARDPRGPAGVLAEIAETTCGFVLARRPA